jgi:hypothetical protein
LVPHRPKEPRRGHRRGGAIAAQPTPTLTSVCWRERPLSGKLTGKAEGLQLAIMNSYS